MPSSRPKNVHGVTQHDAESWRERIYAYAQRILDHLIEDVPLRTYFIFAAGVVVLFGFLYDTLTPLGEGMGCQTADSSLWRGVYFSVVTLSSLGYGDIVPIGYSRVLAAVEVLFGLMFMGILVAKLTSRRLSYQVKRLFATDAQKRLVDLSIDIESHATTIIQSMRDFGACYQQTPTAMPVLVAKPEALRQFQDLLDRLHSSTGALIEYFRYESEQRGYFEVAPPAAINRVISAQDKNLFNLSQLIISLPGEARTEVLDPTNRTKISTILSNSDTTRELIEENTVDSDIRGSCVRLRETCKSVRDAHFSTPDVARIADQPDQIVPKSDEPQQALSQAPAGGTAAKQRS